MSMAALETIVNKWQEDACVSQESREWNVMNALLVLCWPFMDALMVSRIFLHFSLNVCLSSTFSPLSLGTSNCECLILCVLCFLLTTSLLLLSFLQLHSCDFVSITQWCVNCLSFSSLTSLTPTYRIHLSYDIQVMFSNGLFVWIEV
jgi:hypothetical protein